MAETEVSASGAPLDDERFERDLKEMLKDVPNLNDMSSPVQAGTMTPDGKPQAFIHPTDTVRSPTGGGLTHSYSVPPATANIPLSSPERNGQGMPIDTQNRPGNLITPQQSKLDTIKNWSINTYKCTRQLISERLGKGSKTVDLELEAQIEALRDTQRKYSYILRLARALTNHFYHVVQTQRALSDSFSELSQKSPELQEEFSYNAETQRVLCKNGDALLSALNFFTSSVNTLCNKTMEDTLQTVKMYESARIEYDAYRTDLDALNLVVRDNSAGFKMDDASKKYAAHKSKYEQLKQDVAIKLKFLDENRVTVTQRQFFLLHRAFGAYISGSHHELEALLESFNIQPKYPLEHSQVDTSPTQPNAAV